jgi:S-adenosylmethionine:tRNA ribosyltransferase-isomerase
MTDFDQCSRQVEPHVMTDSTQNKKPSRQALTLDDFNFSFPESQIAQNPLPERDGSKLLVWDGRHTSHSFVKNLDSVVPEQSLFIVNNSRVIASRLHGSLPTGGHVEILLIEPDQSNDSKFERWTCLGRPFRKLKTGAVIRLEDNLQAIVIERHDANTDATPLLTVEFNCDGSRLLRWLDQYGDMPLPPYIERKNADQEQIKKDKENYQTVYAEGLGSVAAPTAGLHFSDSLIRRLKERRCEFAEVTLHVGAGTFLPVKSHDPNLHTMHSERFIVPKTTYDSIIRAKSEKRPVIVVGTTALRSLEGLSQLAAREGRSTTDLLDRWLRTDIFIKPTYRDDIYKPWAPDFLMTNFHQPQSTLFMLICALVGFDAAHKIYDDAIKSGYRLFSYGDSSLLSLRAE